MSGDTAGPLLRLGQSDGDERNEWPVPPRTVAGDRDGVRAWAEYLGYRGAVGVLSRLPMGAWAVMSASLARLASLVDTRRTAIARDFIAQALGRELDQAARERIVRAAWRHLIQVVLEDAAFNRRVLAASVADHFEVELSDAAREALAGGSGGFFVTPHVGMWEALPAIASRLGFRPAYVVSRPPRNRPLSRHAQAVRERRGYRLLPRKGAVEDLKTVIAAGGWVGLMLDQRPFDRTVIAPLFGRMAHCERTISVVARRWARPIVFGACYRTDRPLHYRAVIDSVLWPSDLSGLDASGIAAAINRGMERLILRAPEQYLWFHDRFRRPRWSADVPAT